MTLLEVPGPGGEGLGQSLALLMGKASPRPCTRSAGPGAEAEGPFPVEEPRISLRCWDQGLRLAVREGSSSRGQAWLNKQ